jgi:hypothetical protein
VLDEAIPRQHEAPEGKMVQIHVIGYPHFSGDLLDGISHRIRMEISIKSYEMRIPIF